MVSFGLFCLMGYRDRGSAVSEVLGNAVKMVQWAEEAGFEAAWFAEHHFSNYCVCPSPLLMVNHCAGVTTRIKLGPAVIVVPLYHPVRLLAEIGMTQALLGEERFLLGLGSGYQPYEFERFDADLGQSKAELEEFLALMERAYANETFTFDGDFTALPETNISTRPPGGVPPIWVAGDSESTHRLAAQRGFVPIITGRWFGADYLAEQRARIDASYAAEGMGGQKHELGILRFVCVTESDEETRDYLVNARQQMRFAAALRNRQEAMEGGMLDREAVLGRGVAGRDGCQSAGGRCRHGRGAAHRRHPRLGCQPHDAEHPGGGLHHGAGRAHHPGLRQRDQARHRARARRGPRHRRLSGQFSPESAPRSAAQAISSVGHDVSGPWCGARGAAGVSGSRYAVPKPTAQRACHCRRLSPGIPLIPLDPT